jgi:hypothetical protein
MSYMKPTYTLFNPPYVICHMSICHLYLPTPYLNPLLLYETYLLNLYITQENSVVKLSAQKILIVFERIFFETGIKSITYMLNMCIKPIYGIKPIPISICYLFNPTPLYETYPFRNSIMLGQSTTFPRQLPLLPLSPAHSV